MCHYISLTRDFTSSHVIICLEIKTSIPNLPSRLNTQFQFYTCMSFYNMSTSDFNFTHVILFQHKSSISYMSFYFSTDLNFAHKLDYSRLFQYTTSVPHMKCFFFDKIFQFKIYNSISVQIFSFACIMVLIISV